MDEEIIKQDVDHQPHLWSARNACASSLFSASATFLYLNKRNESGMQQMVSSSMTTKQTNSFWPEPAQFPDAKAPVSNSATINKDRMMGKKN